MEYYSILQGGVSGVHTGKYHNGTTLLSAEDAVTEFVLPKQVGADGLIWW